LETDDEKMMKIEFQHYQSPAGNLVLGSFNNRLCLCDWDIEPHHNRIFQRIQKSTQATTEEGCNEVIEKAIAQLDEYFAGNREEFDIPLLFFGTDFQKNVWNTLLKIPYGMTLSYAELAQKAGTPKAVRAIANANGANAISILVPCHRIITSNHKLGGYGGGIEAKKILLELEEKGQREKTLALVNQKVQ